MLIRQSVKDTHAEELLSFMQDRTRRHRIDDLSENPRREARQAD
jgi:hypothetical protein